MPRCDIRVHRYTYIYTYIYIYIYIHIYIHIYKLFAIHAHTHTHVHMIHERIDFLQCARGQKEGGGVLLLFWRVKFGTSLISFTIVFSVVYIYIYIYIFFFHLFFLFSSCRSNSIRFRMKSLLNRFYRDRDIRTTIVHFILQRLRNSFGTRDNSSYSSYSCSFYYLNIQINRSIFINF